MQGDMPCARKHTIQPTPGCPHACHLHVWCLLSELLYMLPQVSFDLDKMTCGSNHCGDGRYVITYFAALSRFTDAGIFIGTPQYGDSLAGNYQGGKQSSTDAFPISPIFIGEAGQWHVLRADALVGRNMCALRTNRHPLLLH